MSLPSPFTYFKYISCINLDSRPDRWAQVTAECEKVGISGLIRQRACTPAEAIESSTFVAFNTSQKHALGAVMRSKQYPALILEDDCAFGPDMHIHYAMNELPEDWEVLYLGANIIGIDTIPFRRPIRYSAHLFKLQDAWMTHAMVYSQRGVSKILNKFKVNCGFNYDEFLRKEIMPDGNCYIIAPQIAYQKASRSDIWNCDTNFEHLFKEGNKLLV